MGNKGDIEAFLDWNVLYNLNENSILCFIFILFSIILIIKIYKKERSVFESFFGLILGNKKFKKIPSPNYGNGILKKRKKKKK